MASDYFWSAEQEAFLRKHYPTMDTHLIAEHLGKPYLAVIMKAQRMKVRKEDDHTIKWTPDMLDKVRRYYPTMFTDALAKWLGVSYSTLRKKAAELGVKKIENFSQVRRADINRMTGEGRKRAGNFSRAQKGVHFSPATEFKPGHETSPEIRAKISRKVREARKRKKILSMYGLD